MELLYNLRFNDLYQLEGLRKIDHYFLTWLTEKNPSIAADIISWRSKTAALNKPHEQATAINQANTIIAAAPLVEEFIISLFNIRNFVSRNPAHEAAIIFSAKRHLVERIAIRKHSSFDNIDIDAIRAQLTKIIRVSLTAPSSQFIIAQQWLRWLANPEEFSEQLALSYQYAAWAALTPEGKTTHNNWPLFTVAQATDYQNLVVVDRPIARDGFNCLDQGLSAPQALDHANYCLYCHHRNKDWCAKGMPATVSANSQYNTPHYNTNPLGNDLHGCPLRQKISEMHEIKAQGYNIGALAIIIIDNPLVAATGHRICNDCSKACIFQKQTPVDTPGVESQILDEVLTLPWGFEIYSLLTKWNPLNFAHPLPYDDSGHNVLVAGMGPAGFTVAHYLLNYGHQVTAIDGLDIAPLPDGLKLTRRSENRPHQKLASGREVIEDSARRTGVYLDVHEDSSTEASHKFSAEVEFPMRSNKDPKLRPIKHLKNLYKPLEQRKIMGFGGVAEYGITARWDKNRLLVIRLLLERRANFSLYGNVRLGSNLSLTQAKDMGFGHVSLCLGAGKPVTMANLPGITAKGVRMAPEFLLNLHLSGTYKFDAASCGLVLRLPIIVIGGGLTAVDAATEALAYYMRYAEKALALEGIEQSLRELPPSQAAQLRTIIAHGKALSEARWKQNFPAISTALLQEWGGVTIVYRRPMIESPAYRTNHHELKAALAQGVKYLENHEPLEIIHDEENFVTGIKLQNTLTGEISIYKAGTVLIGIGTQPNHEIIQQISSLQNKQPNQEIFLSTQYGEKYISYLGDLHQKYQGSVVKAMASAKIAAPQIDAALRKAQALKLKAELQKIFAVKTHSYEQISKKIHQFKVDAPAAARAFRPGQFYRLQIPEQTENIPLHAAVVENDTLTFVVQANGASSQKMIQAIAHKSQLSKEQLAIMGPVGAPLPLVSEKKVLMIGSNVYNSPLIEIGKKLRDNGNKVVFLVNYDNWKDRFLLDHFRQAADQLVWISKQELPSDFCDISFSGSLIQALDKYLQGEICSNYITHFDLGIISVEPQTLKEIRALIQASTMTEKAQALVLVASPMQCMMHGICAQCLQRHQDKNGKAKMIFSCAQPIQSLHTLDIKSLQSRLAQNNISEKISKCRGICRERGAMRAPLPAPSPRHTRAKGPCESRK